jgi:hypothetical protein
MVFFSFISSCPPRRNDPTDVAAERKDKYHLYVAEKPECHVSRFAVPIRTANNARSGQNVARIVEVDPAVSENPVSFARIPIEISNLRKMVLEFSWHLAARRKVQSRRTIFVSQNGKSSVSLPYQHV